MKDRLNYMRCVILLAISTALSIVVLPPTTAAAQELSQDVRDVFEGLLDDLDDDLRQKFQNAIDRNTPIVEFDKEEFRRFRDSPSNPFEGIQHIDPESIEGSVQLKFELPSLRNRVVAVHERQTRKRLRALRPVVGSSAPSTVRLFDGNRQLAMGAIVHPDGYLVTKASEVSLKDDDELKCELFDGKRLPATVVRVDKANDVALLKISATDLTPINWSKTQPMPGAFVVTVAAQGQALALGTYSNVPRAKQGSGQQALLGVSPVTTGQGVQISGVEPDTGAGRAGLKDGDILTRFDGVGMKTVTDLVNQVRLNRKGDKVDIEFLRDGRPQKTTAILDAREVSSDRAKRFKMMNRLGAVLSKRSDNFPVVFQHDSPLFPEQCGGPIVDLQGRVLGLNIARNGRAATFAIPSSHMLTILDDLLRETVARRAQ